MEPTTVVTVALGGLFAWQLSRTMLGKVAPTRARELVQAGAKLVDVRTKAEHDRGHIQGSLHIPVSDLASRTAELGEKSKPVVVYCASGARSASAKSILRRAGFTEVHDLGSIARWG